MKRSLVYLAAFTIVSGAAVARPPLALAQISSAPSPSVGQRVKIRTPQLRAVGAVTQVTPDSVILLSENDARVAIPRAGIASLSVSQGRTAGAGALRGMLWGGGIGAVYALTIFTGPCSASRGERCDPTVNTGQPRDELAAEALFTSLTFGAVIGALVKAEKWNELPLQPSVTVSPRSIGISFAFAR